ncbi:hypothetical protein PYCCODRAFT_1439246 [Trametes coccinea BRFM310]|uniref:Uncharacterized protein n=1 Tax=Trametes coccinea (strain BRFM310) TaxID=1353009 RepID=A0A1Y2IBR7_TRAC3|nr:hypothetical protein PYCCODRAFT_1439246 [Trametes coccinea BRFM310]
MATQNKTSPSPEGAGDSDSAAGVLGQLLNGPDNHQKVLAGCAVLDTILQYAAHPHASEAELMRDVAQALSKPETSARKLIWIPEKLSQLSLAEHRIYLKSFEVGLLLVASVRARFILAVEALAGGVFDDNHAQALEVIEFIHQMAALGFAT